MIIIKNPEWKSLLEEEISLPYYQELSKKIDAAYLSNTVFPKEEQIFSAFEATPFSKVKVILLGQDPYHGSHQAHGLSFSVESPKAKFPPSLRNIFKELEDDLKIFRTERNLTDWASQGVFLLNTVLTVEAGKAGSHRGLGWEKFTNRVISLLNQREDPVIFVLWGKDAQGKVPLITSPQHFILSSPHPSPLSSYRGFFGSKPFSQINQLLKEQGKAEIDFSDSTPLCSLQ